MYRFARGLRPLCQHCDRPHGRGMAQAQAQAAARPQRSVPVHTHTHTHTERERERESTFFFSNACSQVAPFCKMENFFWNSIVHFYKSSSIVLHEREKTREREGGALSDLGRGKFWFHLATMTRCRRNSRTSAMRAACL